MCSETIVPNPLELGEEGGLSDFEKLSNRGVGKIKMLGGGRNWL